VKIVSEEQRINLGDTRHLAMISLIASGGSPVICKELAGHDSQYLMHVLDMVRKGRGYNEDIQSALLRLQHSSSMYSKCLSKNMGGL